MCERESVIERGIVKCSGFRVRLTMRNSCGYFLCLQGVIEAHGRFSWCSHAIVGRNGTIAGFNFPAFCLEYLMLVGCWC